MERELSDAELDGVAGGDTTLTPSQLAALSSRGRGGQSAPTPGASQTNTQTQEIVLSCGTGV
jgi:hypothetical protein